MRLYIQTRIEKECETSVHQRIITDTAKIRNYELQKKLSALEKKLFEAADQHQLNVKQMREDVFAEFGITPNFEPI